MQLGHKIIMSSGGYASRSHTTDALLPYNPKLDIDFENSKFYWDGSSKSLSDLTAATVGGYYLDYGFGFSDAMTVVLDVVVNNNTGSPAGTVFSMTSGYPGGNRLEWSMQDTNYGYFIRPYIKPLSDGSGNYQAISTLSKSDETQARRIFNERHRLIMTLKNGAMITYQVDNGVFRDTENQTVGTLATPTRIGFGNRAWHSGVPDDPSSDATLKRVVLYNRALSESEIAEIGKWGSKKPIHVIGDSFTNLYVFTDHLMDDLSSLGYIAFSQDGLGGTSLAQQAVRLASGPAKWRDSTLLIMDGGLDDTAEDGIAAIQAMVNLLSHDRWLYMQSAPNIAIGDTGRSDWDTRTAAIATFCGSHYVPTLTAIQALSDGSQDDIDFVNDGLWPLSCRTDTTNFHPNDKGSAGLASIAKTALVSAGYV